MAGGKFNLQHHLTFVGTKIYFNGEFNKHHCTQLGVFTIKVFRYNYHPLKRHILNFKIHSEAR